jgi:hypothetical protein
MPFGAVLDAVATADATGRELPHCPEHGHRRRVEMVRGACSGQLDGDLGQVEIGEKEPGMKSGSGLLNAR